MRAFDAAASAGSFAGAGRRLGLSRDQVSKAIVALEHRLGTRLFDRSTRAVTLTDAGANYLERIKQVLAELDAADAAIRATDVKPYGLLTVHAPLSWGMTVLAPLCHRFRELFPGVRVSLVLDDRLIHPFPSHVDVVIQISQRFDGNGDVQKLADVQRRLCASPDYLSQRAPLTTPEDLIDHECVHYLQLASGDQWVLENGGEVRRIQVDGGFASNAGVAVLSSILAGGGIGILPDFLASAPIAEGRLVEILPGWRLPLLQIRVLTHPGTRHIPKVKAYVDFLSGAVADGGFET